MSLESAPFQTLYWKNERLVILDQRRLPEEEVYCACETVDEVAQAIRSLAIRGAPAIGICAAYAVALASRSLNDKAFFNLSDLKKALDPFISQLAETRPTAVNLFWALERMRGALDLFTSQESLNPQAVQEALLSEAERIHVEDIVNNRKIGELGQALLPHEVRVLTHCNAGALATGGFGTALGVIYAARESGKNVHVFVDETRPVLQGSRLTAWELAKHGVPLTLICDNMAGLMMRDAGINCVIVGADRIALNGDVANKIGTYSLAVLAKAHNIPFFVAAPTSTFDRRILAGSDIPIEERQTSEVTQLQGRRLAPPGVQVKNPAFDVTPNVFISAIICEKGVLRPPFPQAIKETIANSASDLA